VGRGGLEPYGALVLRLVLGVIYIAHAYLALVVMGPAKAAEFQRAMHIPLPEIGVWYLIAAHGLGGILLILGLLVRWAALANIPIMMGALWFVHLQQGFFILDGKSGYEYVLVLLGATIAQALLGAGAFTLRK
jgi:putative oxidoreductase